MFLTQVESSKFNEKKPVKNNVISRRFSLRAVKNVKNSRENDSRFSYPPFRLDETPIFDEKTHFERKKRRKKNTHFKRDFTRFLKRQKITSARGVFQEKNHKETLPLT